MAFSSYNAVDKENVEIIRIRPDNITEVLSLFIDEVRCLRSESNDPVENDDLVSAKDDLMQSYRGGNTVDFSDKVQRLAYVFRYTTGHVLAAHSILSKMIEPNVSQDYKIWLEERQGTPLKICSVGGGPGTDILALQSHFKWLATEDGKARHDMTAEFKPPVIEEVTILDRCTAWNELYEALRKTMELPVANYVSFDFDKLATVADAKEWRKSVQNADIVTMFKFVCAVMEKKTSHQIKRIEEQLKELVRRMKKDSLLLYFDSDLPRNGEKVEKVMRQAKFAKFFETSVKCNIFGFDFGVVGPAKNLPLCVQLWWTRRA